MIETQAGVLHRLADTPDAGRPDVWLLHGVFADHHLWDGVIALLRAQAPDVGIVAVDAPGHGVAPPIGDLPTLDAHAHLLGRAIRAHSTGRVVLAGHSWGGMLGLRLAAAAPGTLAGLLLTNTPLLRTSRAGRLGFVAQRTLLRVGFPAAAYGRLAARSLYGDGYRQRRPQIVDDTARIVQRLGRRGASRIIDRVLLEPDDADELLTRVAIPLTVIAGEDDYAGAPDMRARVSERGHDLARHPGGHMGPSEAPDAIGDALLRVIRAIDTGGDQDGARARPVLAAASAASQPRAAAVRTEVRRARR